MSRWRLVYSAGAIELVRRLPPELKPIVRAAIESLRDDPSKGKELKLELSGYRSLRTRRYRVIYRLDEARRAVEIHHFGPRVNVYESFRRLLRGAEPAE